MKKVKENLSDWFYRKFLSKKYLEWTKQGYDRGHAYGMQDFQDAKHWYGEYVKMKEEYLKTKELQQLPGSWFVDHENVMGISKTGVITLNGEQITEVELKNLKSEIRAIRNMEFYKVLNSTLRQKAIEKSVLNSTDLYSLKGNEQILAGKMMIYNLDIINTLINKIDSYKTK